MGREERLGKRKQRSSFINTRIPTLGYYYIITDTDQTEKNYLEGLRDSIPEKLKGKIVIKVAKSRTIDMVEMCRQGASLYPQYSEPWIVFDRDEVSDFDQIIKNAEQLNIHAGWSNPCFEIWLYTYFGLMPNIQDSVTCCNKFSIEFKQKTGQKYDKAEQNLYKKLNHYGNEDEAIELAKKKRAQCIHSGMMIPSQMIPCTMIDVLVESIKRKI